MAVVILVGDGAHANDIYDDFSIRWLHRDWRHPANFRRFPHHHNIGDPRPDEKVGHWYLGINNPWERDRIATELGICDQAWVHHNAYTNASTWDGGTHINYGVTMTRTTLGHHVTVSPGVTICGDVTIGDRVLIGAGATICDRVTIGDDVTIGAGCVVLPESVVDSGSTIVGVPARHLATGVHVK